MSALKIVLNAPWSLLLLVYAILSGPTKVKFSKRPPAVVVSVKSFWWAKLSPGKKGVRAMAIGNVILLGPRLLTGDEAHELIHVEQAMRAPLIHPLLYAFETLHHGVRHNKYEREAYTRAGNPYLTKQV